MRESGLVGSPRKLLEVEVRRFNGWNGSTEDLSTEALKTEPNQERGEEEKNEKKELREKKWGREKKEAKDRKESCIFRMEENPMIVDKLFLLRW